MPKTLDGDGNLTAISDNMVTVQFSRKMGRENYGNEEYGIFAQLCIEPDADGVDIEARVKELSAFLKTLVYDQLGLESSLSENGIVRDGIAPQAPKAAPARRAPAAPAAKPAAGGKPDRTAMWQDWCDSPNNWWDNRDDKTNPKAPDFKGKKGTTYDGEGLWVDKAPAFAQLVLDGEAA